MKARFAGNCEVCGMRIDEGADCGWNTATRRIYHYGCKDFEESNPGKEQIELAEKLGFVDAQKVS